MSLYKEKIEKGPIRKMFGPTKSKIHKWMKNQMNRFIRRQKISEDDVGMKTNKKSYKGWEY